MQNLPKSLQNKLNLRLDNQNLRQLIDFSNLIDFSSNDYLGFSKSEVLFENVHLYLKSNGFAQNGSTGSRLITGNHPLYGLLEKKISDFHESEDAIVFSSGFATNIGFFSSVPQKNDVVLYDEYSHASIREGLLLSQAKSFKFKHNDLIDLERLLKNNQTTANIYVVTESVFSMDGDSPNFEELIKLKNIYSFHLIVDEAHAVGVFGGNGEGLIQSLNYQNDVFARIITFSKSIGCHGGAVLCSTELKKYLVNFARSFIYSTGLTPHTLATVLLAYEHLSINNESLIQLKSNINFFQNEANNVEIKFNLNNSSIQTVLYDNIDFVKNKCKMLLNEGLHVMPILSPTVPKGKERIRICLHSFNTKTEIKTLINLINS